VEVRNESQMATHKMQRDETHRNEVAAKARRKNLKPGEKPKKLKKQKVNRRGVYVPEVGKGTNKREKYKKPTVKQTAKQKLRDKRRK